MSFPAKALFATLPMLLIATGSFARNNQDRRGIPMTGPVAEDGAVVLNGRQARGQPVNEAAG